MNEPPIRQALNLTMDTLAARGRSYRNLVVLISLTGVSVVVAALVTWRFFCLAGLTFLVPLTTSWFYLDARRLRLWSGNIIRICFDGNLDVAVFVSTLSALRHLPQATISGMTEFLTNQHPKAGNLASTNPRQVPADSAERRYFWIVVVSLVGCISIFAGWWTQVWWLQLAGWIGLFSSSLVARLVVGWSPVNLHRSK